jgi:hypothetical protein
MVARGERVHLDTLDLYSARSRRAFVKEAAAELALDPGPVKTDLGWADENPGIWRNWD